MISYNMMYHSTKDSRTQRRLVFKEIALGWAAKEIQVLTKQN
jgi:hypothetical protein